jgi:hypothetical protein
VSRMVEAARVNAEDAILYYAETLREWNAPDDEHTARQLRALSEWAITEAALDVEEHRGD